MSDSYSISGSPERSGKRARLSSKLGNQKENEPPILKKRYNFNAPIDTLRGSGSNFKQPAPHGVKATAQPNPVAVLKVTSPNVFANRMNAPTVLNIQTPTKPVVKTPRKTRSTPLQHLSSDDNIFWAISPVDNKMTGSMGEAVDANDSRSSLSVPSSPLKPEGMTNFLTPNIQNLIDKCTNSTFDASEKTIRKIERSVSDPMVLDEDSRTENTIPIIATKQTLSESMISSIRKLQTKKSFSNRVPFNANKNTPLSNDFNSTSTATSSTPIDKAKKNVSQLLVMIGKSLNTEDELLKPDSEDINEDDLHVALNQTISNIPSSPKLEEKELDQEVIDKKATNIVHETKETTVAIEKERLESDDDDFFSSDIDLDAIDRDVEALEKIRAHTQSKSQPQANQETCPDNNAIGKIHSEDDSFSDDDIDIENLLTQVDLQRTQMQKSKSKDCDLQEKARPSYKDMKIDYEAQLSSRTDSKTSFVKSNINKRNFNRYEINKVTESYYKFKGSEKRQLILNVTCSDLTTKVLMLRDQWAELDYQEGDFIHVTGSGSAGSLIDNTNSVLIWNPDLLLSATMISESVECIRKAVLNSKFSGPGEHVLPMIVGNIVHAIFQSCLSSKNFSDEHIDEVVEEELDAQLIPILSMGKNKQDIKNIVMEHVSYIKDFSQDFLLYPSTDQKPNKFLKKTDLKVTNVLDVEENIWSPMFGLRGLIDVVIEARLNDGSKYVVPMEIKTGREYLTNRAQVSLYTYLLKDRYDVDTNNIFLVYTKQKSSYFDQPSTRDLRLLMNIRNKLSKYLKYGERELPPLKKQASCERCHMVDICMTANKLTEEANQFEDTGISKEMYDRLTIHLEGSNQDKYKQFYNHWDALLTKEEGLMNSMKRELWLMTSKERESAGGKAVGNLKVVECKEEDSTKRFKFSYIFERDPDDKSILLTQLSKNDRIILSDENGSYGLAFGFVQNISPNKIAISTDRKWTNALVKKQGFNNLNNQVFESVLSSEQLSQISPGVSSKRYRIDKDEMFHGLALARFNLLNLFIAETGDSKRRKLIVDLEPPRYNKSPLPFKLPDEGNFNQDQLNSFDKVLRSEDYSLILGMPGTGKTTVIAQLIKFLVANNKTILLASYTHSAVDNILLKLVDDDNVSILRTGSASTVHPSIRKFLVNVEGSKYQIETEEDFENAYLKPMVVATTCLGIKDTAFIHRTHFDYCIIDEASQVSMPISLGPLRYCDKFVLVGDHYQLPPLVLHAGARQGGLDKSLFKILNDNFPESVVELTHQYRMCSDIMLLSNTLIYEGRLKCGSEKVANQSLKIPYPGKIDDLLLNPDVVTDEMKWMDNVLNEQNKVIFLNHDDVPAREIVNGDKLENPKEAQLIDQIIKTLLYCGVEQESIGVMSFYKAQLRHFYRSLAAFKDIEVLTADRFQGRDKDCIIISLVRSNDKNSAGELLKEWRRINVAMTRAKSKLIILGSKKMMQSIDQFKGFMDLIDTKGWICDLPVKADKVYSPMLEAAHLTSQVSASASASDQREKHFKVSSQSKVIQKSIVIRGVLDENK